MNIGSFSFLLMKIILVNSDSFGLKDLWEEIRFIFVLEMDFFLCWFFEFVFVLVNFLVVGGIFKYRLKLIKL